MSFPCLEWYARLAPELLYIIPNVERENYHARCNAVQRIKVIVYKYEAGVSMISLDAKNRVWFGKNELVHPYPPLAIYSRKKNGPENAPPMQRCLHRCEDNEILGGSQISRIAVDERSWTKLTSHPNLIPSASSFPGTKHGRQDFSLIIPSVHQHSRRARFEAYVRTVPKRARLIHESQAPQPRGDRYIIETHSKATAMRSTTSRDTHPSSRSVNSEGEGRSSMKTNVSRARFYANKSERSMMPPRFESTPFVASIEKTLPGSGDALDQSGPRVDN
ncbi:hypothetical protein KM043_008774 [Ampulex compressa]|nr:hypothetical protein KM043_008774 [Ampulex compressa]